MNFISPITQYLIAVYYQHKAHSQMPLKFTRLRLNRLDKGFSQVTIHNPHYPMPKLITISSNSYARAKQSMYNSKDKWHLTIPADLSHNSLELERSSPSSCRTVTSRTVRLELEPVGARLGRQVGVLLHIVTEVLLDNFVRQLVYLHVFMIL